MHGSENVKGIRGSIPGKEKKRQSSVQDTFPVGTVSFSPGGGEVKLLGHETDLHLVPRVRLNGAVSPLPTTPSWF